MRHLQFARNQKDKQFQERSGLLLHDLEDRGSTATLKGEVHLADGVGVQRMTRTMDVAATVRWTYHCEECRAVVGNTVCPASTARAKRLIHSLLRQKL
jgi:hypothetical protein